MDVVLEHKLVEAQIEELRARTLFYTRLTQLATEYLSTRKMTQSTVGPIRLKEDPYRV